LKNPAYTIYSLGDSALTIDFGNIIDLKINEQVIALFDLLTKKPLPATKEVVPAYSTLTIYYNFFEANKKKQADQTAFEWMREQVQTFINNGFETTAKEEKLIRIPVCYADEFGIDINTIAEGNKISVEDIINIHSSGSYKVFMLGFLPGFAYMGQVDERIGYARKQQPVNVVSGSVGIAGRQTGIYPLDSPGGWQIIGRTPLKLFEAQNSNPTLLEAGDTVQFYSITKDEFEDIKARNT
jgi:inhibitor of KinA